MHKDPKQFLMHIADECSYLFTATKDVETFALFIEDETLKRAVIRQCVCIVKRPHSKNTPITVESIVFTYWTTPYGYRREASRLLEKQPNRYHKALENNIKALIGEAWQA